MKTKSVLRLGCGLLLLITTAGPCLAAEGLDEVTKDFTGTIELGVGQADDANYRYGRYTGIDDSSAYVIGNFDLGFRPGRPDYLKFRGRDLGLDSRWLQLEYGEQGNFETYIEYNQLPHLISESAKTPYVGDGGDNLVVGPGLSPSNLRSIELETERKQVNAGAAVFLPKDWKVSLVVRLEHKEGTVWIGGAVQRSCCGAGISVGQSYSVILPEPIDQTTTEMDAALEYNGEKSQLRFTFHGSLFDNDNEALRWEEPGFATGGGTTLPPAGQLALPPDNTFFQVGVSGSTLVSETTRLTGLLSVGLMQQDEDFLPYGLSTPGGLPRSSLDGEVYVYSARAAVSSRPFKPLRLNARYRYDERDNRTPKAAYLYDVMDSGKTPQPAVAVVNEPLSYRKHKADIDANYRFNKQWRGLAGYEYRHTERDNADVERSDEHTVKARLAWQPRDDFDAFVRLAESRRDIDDYDAELVNQNPLLRKYNQADRDRTSAGLRVNYAPYENVNLGLGVDVTDDDFTDSELGLTEAESRSYTLDVGYYPSEDVQVTAFYVHDDNESRQQGSDPGVSPLYAVDFDDAIDTIGFGVNVANVWNNRWDLGVNYRYSKGEGDIEHKDLVAPAASSEFPTLKNSLHAIELTANYRWSKQVTLKTAAVYEHFEAEDWAVDDLPALITTGAGNERLLTLGTESEDYDVFALMIAVQYRF